MGVMMGSDWSYSRHKSQAHAKRPGRFRLYLEGGSAQQVPFGRGHGASCGHRQVIQTDLPSSLIIQVLFVRIGSFPGGRQEWGFSSWRFPETTALFQTSSMVRMSANPDWRVGHLGGLTLPGGWATAGTERNLLHKILDVAAQ